MNICDKCGIAGGYHKRSCSEHPKRQANPPKLIIIPEQREGE